MASNSFFVFFYFSKIFLLLLVYIEVSGGKVMEIKLFAQEVINEAVKLGASDIFIYPNQEEYQLKFRLPNKLIIFKTVVSKAGQDLINYFKFLADMDIAEHRRPQVGSIAKEKFFLRFSSVGDFSGQESMVIRLIYVVGSNKYFMKDQLINLTTHASRRGLILTSGPTGSGKTSTMYEIAKEVGKNKVVMTIEDPVEIYEPTFLQTQINLEANISYESLLKAALRQRPDILLVGEIRDSLTARLAVDAALSGHLVLATLHAKSTLQVISRLQGLGIGQAELANCLTAVSYQRLIPMKSGEVACLLDIAAGKRLNSEFETQWHGDFITWTDNLKFLLKEGIISAADFDRFQEG